MNKNAILIKNTLILGIGQFIPKIISIIILPILTYYLTTSDYGIYDLILSLANLMLPFFTLMIQQAVFRYLINSDTDEKNAKYITNVYIIVTFFVIIWFFLLSFCLMFFNKDFLLFLPIYILYFFQAIYDINCQIARGFGENKTYSVSVIIYAFVNLLFLIGLWFFNLINISNVIIIMCFSYFAAYIYIYCKIKIFKYLSFCYFDKSIIKKLLKYSIPMIPSTISLWVVNLSDRLLITRFLNVSMNGIYAAANKVPNLFGTAYSIFNLAWTELASRTIKEKNSSEYYSSLFSYLYKFLVGSILILITFSPVIFHFLIDEKFIDGYWQMPLLFLGVFFNSLVSYYGGIYVALEKTKNVGISSMVGAIINIVINVIFINKIGLFAASISTFVSFFIIFLYRYFNLKKYINIKYNILELCNGIIFIIIIIILFYINTTFSFIASLIISIIYNIMFNKIIFKFIHMIKRRVSNEKI